MIAIVIIIFNLLVYSLAFYVSRRTGQSATVYFVYLAIQVLFLLWYFQEKSIPSQSDAAGSGMAQVYLALICIALQVGMALLALLTLGVRQVSSSGWGTAGIIVLIIGVLFFFFLMDYRGIFLTLTSGTNEEKLVQQDSIMYDQKGKPFTGTAYLKGHMETSFSQNSNGMCITQYKEGLKDGTEKLYYAPDWVIFGGKTSINRISHYRNGVKHGKETVYFPNAKDIEIESNYANGKLDGLYRKFYYPDENNEKRIEVEAQYTDGEINGFYRSYYDEGNEIENYTAENGRIIDGSRWVIQRGNPKIPFIHEYYSNGQLIEQSAYAHRILYRPTDGLLYTIQYENGEISNIYEFDENGKVIVHKKRINNVLIEIFNK